MLSSFILAAAFQIGPFYEQKPDLIAVRPFAAVENETTDVLWPVFTKHRDWWRFAFIAWWQDFPEEDSFQFSLLPVWFNGRDRRGESYWGAFPLWGEHPNLFGMEHFRFAFWPLWHRYETPRRGERMVTDAVLFPFFSWRSDGSWGIWPLCGVNHQRESDHRYALWPIATWADYRADRDTAGAGTSWMLWPLYGRIRREREQQDLFVPPLFSFARVWSKSWADAGNSGPEIRLRAPWPLVDCESTYSRTRVSFWPFYEKVTNFEYGSKKKSSSVTRFGWKLVEIYDDEWRVFPFVASGRNHFRIWPFWESETDDGVNKGRFLSPIPIRWIPGVERNWSKFWTFYENETHPDRVEHSLFWGIIRWRTGE